jgi:hypothetical protein
MKFKVLAAFSIVLIILGVASLGTVLQELSDNIREDTFLGFTMAAGFITIGACGYLAARKRYSAGWRMYTGVFLAFFGLIGASIETDSIVNLRAEEPVFGFVLAGAFVVWGFLLTRSGYKRNLKRTSAVTVRDFKPSPGAPAMESTPRTEVQEQQGIEAGTGAWKR